MAREDVVYLQWEIRLSQILMIGGFVGLMAICANVLTTAAETGSVGLYVFAGACAVSACGLLVWMHALIARNGGYIRYVNDELAKDTEEKDIERWEQYKEKLSGGLVGLGVGLTATAPLVAIAYALFAAAAFIT